MKTVSFKEYEDAKSEIIQGVEWKEFTEFPNQYGMMSKTYCTENNGNFYEVTDPNTRITEFWSDKHSTSRYYDGRTREEIIAQYEAQIEALKKENARLSVERNQFRQNWNDSCLVSDSLHKQIKEANEKLSAIANITKGAAA